MLRCIEIIGKTNIYEKLNGGGGGVRRDGSTQGHGVFIFPALAEFQRHSSRAVPRSALC